MLGSFLDPVADKLFVATVSLSLCFANLLPAALVGVIYARDLILVGGAFYWRAKTKSTEADFFNTSKDATFEVKPDSLGKANTVLQFSLLGLVLLNQTAELGIDAALGGMW